MQMQHCPKCGEKLKPQARFCISCGTKIRQPAPQTRNRQRGLKDRKKQREKQRRALLSMMAGGVLLILAALFLLPQKPTSPSSTIPDVHDEEGIPYPEVPRISVTEAKARYDAGAAIFVDVRTQGQYETAHIPQAISLPLADLEARYQELPKDAEIITYCT
jgi:predicted nucleic acid-binding Zn ribbon protein